MALALPPASAGGGGKGARYGWKGGGGVANWHPQPLNHGFGINTSVAAMATTDVFVTRRVPTPFGYRWRTVNVCGY